MMSPTPDSGEGEGYAKYINGSLASAMGLASPEGSVMGERERERGGSGSGSGNGKGAGKIDWVMSGKIEDTDWVGRLKQDM